MRPNVRHGIFLWYRVLLGSQKCPLLLEMVTMVTIRGTRAVVTVLHQSSIRNTAIKRVSPEEPFHRQNVQTRWVKAPADMRGCHDNATVPTPSSLKT